MIYNEPFNIKKTEKKIDQNQPNHVMLISIKDYSAYISSILVVTCFYNNINLSNNVNALYLIIPNQINVRNNLRLIMQFLVANLFFKIFRFMIYNSLK